MNLEQAGLGSQIPSRPGRFEDRYRLYLDESGDHVFRDVIEPSHRFLCLLGCWFRNPDYLKFHEALEELKSRLLPHHPDDPVILHRKDMLNANGLDPFARRAVEVVECKFKRHLYNGKVEGYGTVLFPKG